jgi:hypothetical protein
MISISMKTSLTVLSNTNLISHTNIINIHIMEQYIVRKDCSVVHGLLCTCTSIQRKIFLRVNAQQ